MGQPLEVVAYAGYRGEQEPRALVLDGERVKVAEVRRRWRGPDGRYFDVRLADDRRLLLRCGGEDRSWSRVREMEEPGSCAGRSTPPASRGSSLDLWRRRETAGRRFSRG